MIAAEQWYEYQENYKKYGIDMQPVKQNMPQRKIKNGVKNNVFSAKDKFKLVLVAILAGILGVAVIICSAYAANLKYEINLIIKDNGIMSSEIQTMSVKVMEATNIAAIEEKAINELGMVKPKASEFIFLTEQEVPSSEFAVLLKEQAYNRS